MSIREQLEQQELQYLSPNACTNIGHAHRMRPEEPCPYRTAFQRDRDRILHCNFISPTEKKNTGVPIPCRRSIIVHVLRIRWRLHRSHVPFPVRCV